MEMLRNAVLPRRLTQMYADTKRSYEHVVQKNSKNHPQLASLHLKLRIQKDRLFAWGLQWNDSDAAQLGDIDSSLDRAGISDLVASIMSSIQQLLDEAERIQPPQIREPPGAFPDDKLVDQGGRFGDWTVPAVARLEDILKDITSSIDTLCDLSKYQHSEPRTFGKTPIETFESPSPQTVQESKPVGRKVSSSAFPLSLDYISSTHIDLEQLRFPEDSKALGPSPPSYESVTAGSDNRILAYLIDPGVLNGLKGEKCQENCDGERPVLLDYGAVQDTDPINGGLPSLRRYEALVSYSQTFEQQTQSARGNNYAKPLKIAGWFKDHRRSIYAFAYQFPSFPSKASSKRTGSLKDHSLLSFLQHGADTDSSNMPNLEDRFRLAFTLATTIRDLHAKGLTHRNINSSNVLFFLERTMSISGESRSWKTGAIRHPFITSFDQCDDDSQSPHQEPLISSMYRHPMNERGQRTSFKLSFDVYSLGLILLEIGLWMPINKLWKTKYTRFDFKARLQSIYVKKLAAKCGSTYMRVVEYCLKVGDGDMVPQSHSSGIIGKSRPDDTFNTHFFWNAAKPLERCCSIDDLERPYLEYGDAQLKKAAEEPKVEAQPVASGSEIDPIAPLMEAPASELRQPGTQESSDLPSKSKCKLKVWSHELPIACAKYWYAKMLPELEEILKRIIDRWESYSIDLFMVGETAEQARPTIYMMCASVEKARKALQYVNKEQRLFDIKVVKGQISRSKASRKKKRNKRPSKATQPKDTSNPQSRLESEQRPNSHYQPKPACGASIGAYMDKQHLPPVSFGGTVLIDGEPYGMSVHHMLEDDEVDLGLDDTIDPLHSMASASEAVSFNDALVGNSWCPESLPEALYPFEISEDEEEEYQSSVDDDDSWLFDVIQSQDEQVDDDVNMGDTMGIAPGQGQDLIVTQPAIDDVHCDFFPNEEDMDDDHLSSHSFGHIHASSGIKRSTRGSISHEIDWALIKVHENRLRGTNVVIGGAKHCKSSAALKPAISDSDEIDALSPIHQSASYPHQIVKAEELGGLHVHALGRTSGLQTGVILPTMAMVKMPGRVSCSHSWQVMGNFGGASRLIPFPFPPPSNPTSRPPFQC